MGRSAKIREQLISSFRAELTEHIQTMTDGLLALEQGRVVSNERQDTLETVFRAAHSLKGAARAVNVTVVEQLAHSLENVLDAMQQGTIAPTSELYTACYRALDAIQAVQAAYEAGETTPPLEAVIALADLEALRARPGIIPVEPEPPLEEGAYPDRDTAPGLALAPGSDETIRVNVNKLDALMAQLSELLVTKIRAEQRLVQMRQFQEFIALWQRDWLSMRSTHGRLVHQEAKGDLTEGGLTRNGGRKDLLKLLDYVDASQDRLAEMGSLVNNLSRQYANDTAQMSLVIDELEEEIKQVRMLPLSTITGPFGRMVRDLAKEAGKEAVLEIVGSDTELDKQVLEQIKDPLIHMLRNAIDHGIEPPDEREAAGKPRAGNITLAAEQLGQNVVICVSDNGAGLDLVAIRRALSRQGRADAYSLSDEDLENIIFTAGISTSPIITDISGRGIGLNVVRRNVEVLHGRIDVDWAPGKGVTFTLTLPLTLISSRGLLVHASGQRFVIPLNVVEHILAVSPEEISSLEGHDAIRYDGRPITLVRLDDVLGLPRVNGEGNGSRTPAVIVETAERRLAFAVDDLAGEQEVVIKGLGKQLARVAGVAGATVMGDGEVVLILNAVDLVKLAFRGEHRPVFVEPEEGTSPEEVRAQQRILIVDDSITTRTLEKNILEAVGYTVEIATDGQEALNAIAAGGAPDLIVSDILMPRMNGFELTERVKGDEHTAHVPVILVSSLDSAADKTRGIEVGADAYIVKGHFDQSNLLETIEQLI